MLVKDFITSQEINVGNLHKMVQYALEAEEFSMGNWFNLCGTAGCLCGTYCIRENFGRISEKARISNRIYYKIDLDWIQNELNMSQKEFWWLFLDDEYVRNTQANKLSSYLESEHAIRLTKEQAINRLRKFIVYKIRKAELLKDYEASRRLEGNQNYLKQVLEFVEQIETVTV